jgi:hypothetical protein
MEDSTKKTVLGVVIVVCIVAAGIITYATRSRSGGGLEAVQRGTMIWLKCTNADCENTWQMDQKDYFEYLKEHRDPMQMAAPGVLCPKCSQDSGYAAEKCGKCETIFLRASVPHDFADRCPECGYSKTEEARKAARKGE